MLVSGGVDSTTCLGLMVKKYGKENVVALSISYGQKHTKEIEASEAVTRFYQVEYLKMDLSSMFQYSDCSLLEHSHQDIPKESLAAQLEKTDGNLSALMCHFVTGYFYLPPPQLQFLKAAIQSIMVHIVMMLLEVHILTVVLNLIRQ